MTEVNLKQLAALKALNYVHCGMNLGLGTGSTANEFIKLLSNKIKNGLEIKAIATSRQTEELCAKLQIKLYDLNDLIKLDLIIDGADEITTYRNAIKGGGGALLREKIAAMASTTKIIIVDESKLVKKLGAYPLPIEISKFGYESTKAMCAELLEDLGYKNFTLNWRKTINNELFISDGGNYILDAHLGVINNIENFDISLLKIPGVVEHGLFLNIASKAIIAMKSGEVDII